MKETNLNTIKSEAELYVTMNEPIILEEISRDDLVNWFVQAYINNDRTKEYTARFNRGGKRDITIITTSTKISIIDNTDGKATWGKQDGPLCQYNVSVYNDLDSLNRMLDFVYIRMLFDA